MASLCISCPLQAGIISFRIPNSSFILLRRLRSIRLWAVLRAIFRPAAVAPPVPPRFLPPLAIGAEASGCSVMVLGCSSFGFICMIFRDLEGGGGSAKLSPVFATAFDVIDGLRLAVLGETGLAG